MTANPWAAPTMPLRRLVSDVSILVFRWVVFPIFLRLVWLIVTVVRPIVDVASKVVFMIPGANWLAGIVGHFATEHRSWLIVFLVPASLAFDAYYWARAWITWQFFSDPLLHQQRVDDIARQVKAAVGKDPSTKLCTARPGWESMTGNYRDYKKVASNISVPLYDILELDPSSRTLRCEPCVNMGQLSHYLAKRGYTIPVLPEMDDLTVGGLFLGVGIETSSHKFGLFNDSVVSATIVTATGDVVTASRDTNRDIFDALPWSYGTLGFLVEVKLRVIPAKPYVKVDYLPYTSLKEGLKAFETLSQQQGPDSPDFVEALMFSKDTIVVMPAWWASTDEVIQAEKNKTGKKNVISWWFKPWFYKHVESFLKASPMPASVTEYIPLRDYYHRHTKSIFWSLEMVVPAGAHPLFRFVFGWALPPKIAFLKLTQTEALRVQQEQNAVAQDMLVPISEAGAALDEFHDAYEIYPIWICPYRAYDYSATPCAGGKSPGHRHFTGKPRATGVDTSGGPHDGWRFEMFVDLGAYGLPRCVKEKTKPFDSIATGRRVESWVGRHRGFQMLYADVWMDRDEFYSMFDHRHYEAMKAKLDPNSNFPVIYSKVAKKAVAAWVKNKKEPTTRA